MPQARTLGVRRIVDEIRTVNQSDLRGVALFATAGTIAAVMKAENPMRDGRREVEAVRARAAASRLPPVVALAVGLDTVSVYPTTSEGKLLGGVFAVWNVGDFRAAARRHLILVRLTIVLRDGDRFDRNGERFEIETKSFPVGPNRFNAGITDMIVQMGRESLPTQ